MHKLFFSLGVIFLGLFLGQTLKYALRNTSSKKLSWAMDGTRKIAFLVLNPIIMINSYWIIDFSNISLIFIPFICLITLFILGMTGLLFGKLKKYDGRRLSAMFSSATFSNLGTIGGLVTFSLLGEGAFAIASMYFVFESIYNYLFAYPFTKRLVSEKAENKNNSILKMFLDPTILVYIGGIICGIALNFSGIMRPKFMSAYNEAMIPIVSFLLIITISFGMNLSVKALRFKEGLFVVFLKYVLAPIVGVALVYIFGLNKIMNGMVLKVIIIMSLVPCGFNSIIIPTLYNVDKEIANSSWLFTMLFLIVIIPLEFILLS